VVEGGDDEADEHLPYGDTARCIRRLQMVFGIAPSCLG
jgi:hypothetical protein